MMREEVSILVVDDVQAMRTQIKDLLKGFGFSNVRVASNGVEARAAFMIAPVHLVLCDWQMQPTDGMELLRFLRTHPDHRGVAFIMVTAESTKEKVIEAIKSGVDDYLVKPLTLAQIQTKVYGVLLRKQVLQA